MLIIEFVILNFLVLLLNVSYLDYCVIVKNDRYQRRIPMIYNMTLV